jgi:hypothetical protein
MKQVNSKDRIHREDIVLQPSTRFEEKLAIPSGLSASLGLVGNANQLVVINRFNKAFP